MTRSPFAGQNLLAYLSGVAGVRGWTERQLQVGYANQTSGGNIMIGIAFLTRTLTIPFFPTVIIHLSLKNGVEQ